MFQSSWPNEYSGTIDNAPGITWSWCLCHQYQITKNHVVSYLRHLELTNAVVLLMMPAVSYDANTGITWPKHHVSPCFNHHDLSNKMVLLTMPSVSCNAHLSDNTITWPKESCHPCFSCLHSKTKLCYWWCSKHHMAAMLVVIVSHKWKILSNTNFLCNRIDFSQSTSFCQSNWHGFIQCMGKYFLCHNTHFGWCMWNVIIYNFEFCFRPNRIVTIILNVFNQLFDVIVTDVFVTN